MGSGNNHNHNRQPAEATRVVPAAVLETEPVPGGFQSHAAAEADAERRRLENAGPSNQKVMGEVGASLPDKGEVLPVQMVTIRSRQKIEPFTYGDKRYALRPGQPTLVPIHIKNHLIEKGLLDG